MSQALQIHEQRCGLRYFADYEVIVTAATENDGVISERSVLTDISLEGVNFVTRHEERYRPGAAVMLQIQLPVEMYPEGLVVFGRVAWAGESDISACGEMIRARVGVSLDEGDMSRLLKPLNI